MLKKRLSSWIDAVRSGVAFARLTAAGRRSRTYGRDARTNGRTCVRMIGSASRTNGKTSRLATSIWRTAGRSDSSDDARIGENVCTLFSVSDVVRSVGDSFWTDDVRFDSCDAND